MKDTANEWLPTKSEFSPKIQGKLCYVKFNESESSRCWVVEWSDDNEEWNFWSNEVSAKEYYGDKPTHFQLK